MNGNTAHNQRLDSWKEIAAYLRRDERTAIRWEKAKGLPIRRVPGGKRKTVFAYTAELDAWLTDEKSVDITAVEELPNQLETEDEPKVTNHTELKPVDHFVPRGTAKAIPTPSHVVLRGTDQPSPFRASAIDDFEVRGRYIRLARYAGVAVGLLIIIGTIVFLFGSRFRMASAEVPVRIGFSLNAVQAFDSKDKMLWEHTYPLPLELDAPSAENHLTDVSRISDFREDGQREALVGVVFHVDHDRNDPNPSEVDLFSTTGQRLWSYIPHGKFQFGQHELDGPWYLMDIFAPSQPSHKIWAAFEHGIWGNAYIVNLDPFDGRENLRFVNTGVLYALNEVQSGTKTYVLAGGFNNEANAGSLAVIDEDIPFAASPQTPGSRHECLSCPAGKPDYYFVFPRSELSDIREIHEDSVIHVSVNHGQIEVEKGEPTKGDSARIHYVILSNEKFRVASLRFSSDYDEVHRRYEREGKIDHTLEKCPERLHPKPIKMWTPSTGWTEIQIPPTPFNQ
jgi:hypothetical protein